MWALHWTHFKLKFLTFMHYLYMVGSDTKWKKKKKFIWTWELITLNYLITQKGIRWLHRRRSLNKHIKYISKYKHKDFNGYSWISADKEATGDLHLIKKGSWKNPIKILCACVFE